MSIRLIAIDIDGTLLDSQGQLPNVNRSVIANVIADGVHIILATGRSFHDAQPITNNLSSQLTFIVSNGALIKTSKGETIVRHLLPRTVAKEIILATRPFREGAAIVFDRSDDCPFVFERIDWKHPNRRRYFERNQRFIMEATPLENSLSEDPIQVSFTGEVEAMRELAVFVRKLACENKFTVTLTEYANRNFSLLDVTACGCSKGTTLAEWTERLGLTPANVMAIGDNLNDREMLEFAGQPVIMGNAVAELQGFGWLQTTSNDEDGVALAIRKNLLNRT